MLRQLRAPARDRGATALEYALIVGAVALIVIVGLVALGNAVGNPFTESAACALDKAQC